MRKCPKCPECNKLLKIVYETTYDRYIFDKKTKHYADGSIFEGEIEIRCPCGADVGDIFMEGVCNY